MRAQERSLVTIHDSCPHPACVVSISRCGSHCHECIEIPLCLEVMGCWKNSQTAWNTNKDGSVLCETLLHLFNCNCTWPHLHCGAGKGKSSGKWKSENSMIQDYVEDSSANASMCFYQPQKLAFEPSNYSFLTGRGHCIFLRINIPSVWK